ncbi:MAG: hypothetical protein M1813_005633 [Trichoglossum hirsutum]|nr:MAG: hypothetical protein M1813_005633 [Trichoglossum hirsutum]
MLAFPLLLLAGFTANAQITRPSPPSIFDCMWLLSRPPIPPELFCAPLVEPTDPTLSHTRQMSGQQISFFYDTKGWSERRGRYIKTMLDNTVAAAQDSLAVYSRLVSTPMNIDIVLVDRIDTGTLQGSPSPGPQALVGAVTQPSDDKTSCFVRLRLLPPGSFIMKHYKQLVAHELYHCVQKHNRPDPGSGGSYGASRWWREGTADYFSNVVYPSAGSEEMTSKLYTPGRSLLHQDNPYSTNVFFQFLENSGWDSIKINGLVKGWPGKIDLPDEQARVSGDPDVRAQFPKFAQALVGGNIRDTSGSPSPVRKPETVEVPLPTGEGSESERPVEIEQFAMSTFTVTVKPGEKYLIDFKTTKPYMNGYVQADGNWVPFLNNQDLPITLDIPCSGAATAFKFLATSTDEQPLVQGRFRFRKQKQEDCKKPKACSTSTTPPSRFRRQQSNSTEECAPSSGTCADRGTPLDSCLLGPWTLDLDNMKSILEQAAPTSVSNIALSGTGAFDIENPNSAAATYSGFILSMAVGAGGLVFDTTTKVNGEFKASLFMQDAGHFCLNIDSGTGEADIDLGLGGDPLAIQLADGFVPRGMVISYTCDANTLTMMGLNAGMQQWVYSYKR